MEVIVTVSQAVARVLHQRSPRTAGTDQLMHIVATLGVTLEPMHRGTDDLQLMRYFVVQVPDAVTAQRVIDQLQQSGVVEGAYLKPRDEAP